MRIITKMRRIKGDDKRSNNARWATNNRKLERQYKGQIRNA